MSNDRIALEVRASQLAGEKIKKMISKFERMGGKEIVNKEEYIQITQDFYNIFECGLYKISGGRFVNKLLKQKD
jgi:hypothetical protein